MFRTALVVCPRDGTRLVSADDDPLIASTLADRYVIEQLLAEGGMGRVYAARHRNLSRRFAVKVMFGEFSLDPKMAVRFAHEAEAASRLDHPNLIGVVDFGEDDHGLLYLVMDLASGRSLGEILRDEGRLEPARAARITRQLAEGLHHAHGRGLIHRDFKPDNVMIGLSDDGVETVRIVDFGIAKFDDSSGARVTTDGTVIGTPQYMAPEQATNAGVDHRTDLYALGVVLYEMLAGVLPFDGNAVAIARQHIAVDPPPIAVRVPGLTVDPLLEDLALRLMAKDPEHRPASGRDVVALLEAAQPAPAWLPGDGVDTETWDPSAGPRPGRAADVPGVTGSGRGSARALPLAVPVTREETAVRPAMSRGQDAATSAITPAGRGSRRVALVALGVGLAAVALAIAVVATRPAPSRRTPPIATSPREPAPRPVVIALDAGAAAVPAVDAAEPEAIAVAPTGSGSDGRRPRPVNRTERADADAGAGTAVHDPGSGSATVPPPEPPPEPAITAEELTGRYAAVGRTLDDQIKRLGDEAVAPLRRRYLAIPYVDALRKPALRPSALAELTAIEAAARRLGGA